MSSTMFGVPVSVIILTYNEEVNIRHCLESVKYLSAEIFVVDSFSTDKTLEIAQEYTPHIYQNVWVHWAHQRNWALDNLPLSHDWVLFLDADERLTPELGAEMADTLARPQPQMAGYFIRRNFYFLGRWLKHGGYQADYVLRLVQKTRAHSVGSGAREYVTVTGKLGRLEHPMIHEDKKGLSAWIDKHNCLADLEARETLNLKADQGLSSQMAGQGGQKIEHGTKIWLREKVWVRMPPLLRPLFYFGYRYIFQLGFLDGKEGLIYCFLHGFWYPFLVDSKYLELKKFKEAAALPK